MATSVEPLRNHLTKRMMPAPGTAPQISGMDIYGESKPLEETCGDYFNYLNFHYRHNLDAWVKRTEKLSQMYREGELPPHVDGLFEYARKKKNVLGNYCGEEILRIAKSIQEEYVAHTIKTKLMHTGGFVLADFEGHGDIAQAIAYGFHHTFFAEELYEIAEHGEITMNLVKRLFIRCATSANIRNYQGAEEKKEKDGPRQLGTALIVESNSNGMLRMVNMGHQPPRVFSASQNKFLEVSKECQAQFLPLGYELPDEHPDKEKYISLHYRRKPLDKDDVGATKLERGDILFAYTDGIIEGRDEERERDLEQVIARYKDASAKIICQAIFDYAERYPREPKDKPDDKTIAIIKRT